ncbi:MAG TPA: M48 family metalloprotease [Gaiellales bacterium]|nr:M48 family metalloprotease [Gaiellales bacterium]
MIRRLPGLVLFAALGGLAAWLWQADLPPRMPHLAARAAFTQSQIDRAADYRGPQYLLALAALVLEPAAGLAWARWGRACAVRSLPPALAGGVAAAAAATVAAAALLPLGYVGHVRAANAGLDLRSAAAWARDSGIGLATWAAGVAIAYSACLAIGRRARKPWLAVGIAAWVAVAVFVAIQPVAIDPLFASTHPVRDPAVRTLIRSVEHQVGAAPGSVSVSDASARTTEENAFVDGVGPTERLVVYDTVLHRAPVNQTRALLAHELSHVKRRHTLKGVLWFGVLGLPALWAVLALAGRAARRRGLDGALDPRAAPLVVAGLLVAAALLTPVENGISRRYEAEADWTALRATGDGDGMSGLQKRLALADLSNPDPPRWAVVLLFDHPPVMERIAVARG